MFAKYMTTVLVGSAMLATAVMAQTPSTSTTATPPAATTMAPAAEPSSSHQGEWRASKVVGLRIYNDANESLGSVNDLLFDRQGRIQAAVIGVGGFLGVGEHYVSIPFEKIKWVDTPVKPSTTASNSSAGTMGRRPAGTTTGAATSAPPPKTNPWYPDHGVFSATKEQLKNMPEFKYSS